MKEKTYTVSWERKEYPDDGILKYSGLTRRVAFARLIGAINNSGPVIIHIIEPEKDGNEK